MEWNKWILSVTYQHQQFKFQSISDDVAQEH